MKPRFAQSPATPAEHEFILWLNVAHPQIRTVMKRKSPPASCQPSEAQIQHAAYLLWVEEGCPEGRDQQHWFAAKEMLVHRHGRDAKTRGPAVEIQARNSRSTSGKN
jgi:hypothetical protein